MAFKPAARTSSSKPVAKKPSGFVYHPRSAEAIKARAERTGGRFDSPFKDNTDTFRPKVGDNLIRILPPTWEPHDHYGFQIWVHRRIGPDSSTYLCPREMLNKKCPVCEAEKESRDAGETDEAKALAPAEQFVCWIVDRDDDNPIAKIYPLSWTQDRDLAALCHNPRKGQVLLIDHPDKGYDIIIKRHGQGLNTKYQFAVDREKTPISDDGKVQQEILDFITENPVPTMLKYYSYEYLENVLSGGAEEADPELDETDTEAAEEAEAESDNEEEEAQTAARGRKRPRAEPEEEEVEEEVAEDEEGVVEAEEEEEVEEEPTPRRVAAKRPVATAKRPARRPEPEPEEEEEETVEETDEEEYDPETGEIIEEEEVAPRRPVRPAARPVVRTGKPAARPGVTRVVRHPR
jgi:hypothetical protein